MSQSSHLNELMNKHRRLDVSIQSELSHPAYDEMKVANLKRQKLRLKEQIAKLSQRPQ